MINVCYFERLLNVNLFEQVLTEGGGIALSRVSPEMADADIAAALSGIQGYHTRGGSQLVPPKPPSCITSTGSGRSPSR